ncbi:sodium/glutamate symporter [Pseudochelatococcus sp. B33]
MTTVGDFISFTIAIMLLMSGKLFTIKYYFLREYSIPEPVIGGLLCSAIVSLVYFLFGHKISFELDVRDFLLLLFFAGIGLKADVRTLRRGGRPLLVLLALATVFMVGQNVAGMGMAALFGLDARAGLMVGSISLTGGLGTTLAWAPIFEENLGIHNAAELGIASNTVGLIAACVIGGPLAAWLMRRHAVTPSGIADLDIGTSHESQGANLDYFCVLWAVFILNVTVLIGTGLDALVDETGITLPTFVACLVAGIAVRNLTPLAAGKTVMRYWPGTRQGLALVSDMSLGLFLTMALMNLQLWELAGIFGFIISTLAVQILLSLAYILCIVFPVMGRDYEATVIGAGFSGITLGSTATAIANMTAVTQQYGAAHRAFIIVPLVCGFFIDLVNALVIAAFVG